MTVETELPPGQPTPSSRQWTFNRYLVFVLVDLVVINFFVEYWDRVEIDSFTISLLTAALMQLLLKLTIAIEHGLAKFIKERATRAATARRLFATWVVLFVSKFAILEVVNIVFGEHVQFGGIVPFIVVVFAILAAEFLVVKSYSLLADKETDE